MGSERDIYSENQMCSHVEAVETYRILLKYSFQLDLVNTFYVPLFSRNLVSISKLTCLRFEFNFHDLVVDLLKHKNIIDSEILVDSLFRFAFRAHL